MTGEAFQMTDEQESPDQTIEASESPAMFQSKQTSAFNHGNLMLVAMFVAALVGVFFLRMQIGPEKASAKQRKAERQVDSALSLLSNIPSGMLKSDIASVLDTFCYEAEQRQVPPDQLSGNPFILNLPEMKQNDGSSSSRKSADEIARISLKQKQKQQAFSQARTFNLQSVLMGKNGAMAMISDQLLTDGQRIGLWTVARITPQQVFLKWRDQQYILQMSQ